MDSRDVAQRELDVVGRGAADRQGAVGRGRGRIRSELLTDAPAGDAEPFRDGGPHERARVLDNGSVGRRIDRNEWRGGGPVGEPGGPAARAVRAGCPPPRESGWAPVG